MVDSSSRRVNKIGTLPLRKRAWFRVPTQSAGLARSFSLPVWPLSMVAAVHDPLTSADRDAVFKGKERSFAANEGKIPTTIAENANG